MGAICQTARFGGIVIAALVLAGCRSAAPLHVWAPPGLASAVGGKIAVAPIRGDDKVAGPLRQAMLRQQPQDQGRSVVAIDARQLQGDGSIRLVSSLEGDDSDFAVLSLARRAEIDFVLMGHVIAPTERRLTPSFETPMGGAPEPGLAPQWHSGDENSATAAADPREQAIRVSWSLFDVRRGQPLSGQPVVTPGNPRSPTDRDLDTAAAAAWELLIPHVVQTKAELAAPRLAPGSRPIRQGNDAAAAGDWQQAEQIWQRVLDKQPKNHAALHNLAVAAVARQQYSEARSLIAAAVAIRSHELYRSTAVWIEQSQRDYHEAFALDDPAEGWAATRR